MVETSFDGRGHVYTNVGNIRITYVPAADRSDSKNWLGSDVLRIQAYRDDVPNRSIGVQSFRSDHRMPLSN